MKYEKIYRELLKTYTKEEIVDSMMIPADLTDKEKKELGAEMKAYRMESLKNMKQEDWILSDVMRLKFQIEKYVKKEDFSFDKTFGKYLAEYIRALRKPRKDIANDLAIHYTKLSRIINDKEEPNIELCYRLEKYSGELIRAELWWKLIIKKQEFILTKDNETRKVEWGKVKNALRA